MHHLFWREVDRFHKRADRRMRFLKSYHFPPPFVRLGEGEPASVVVIVTLERHHHR